MTFIKAAGIFSSAFLALSLSSCSRGFSAANQPTTTLASPQQQQAVQVLYVAQRQTVSTYTINASDGSMDLVSTVQVASSFSPGFGPMQVFAPPNHFLYVHWMDSAGNAHLSVFTTGSRGVPQTPSVQTVDLAAGAEVSFDPAGRFGYSMVAQSVPAQQPFDSAASTTIHQWTIDPQTGRLSDDGNQAQEPVVSDGFYSFAIVGPIASGNAVILRWDTSNIRAGSSVGYVMHSVNADTGALEPRQALFGIAWGSSDVHQLALSPKYVAHLFDTEEQHLPDFTGIEILSTSDTSSPLIDCRSTMSDACLNANDIFFDPSGNFLFVSDPVKKSIRVMQVDATAKMLRDTGTSIPFTSDGGPFLQFSADAKLVFSFANGALQVMQFNAASGALTPIGAPAPLAVPFALTSTER